MPKITMLYELDFAILDFIAANLKCAFLDFIMPIITFLGDGGWFWIAVAVVMLIFKKTRKTGVMMAAALLCGLIFGNLLLKPLIARVRPYDLREGIELLIPKPSDYSFPSGHTLASFEAAVVLMVRERKRFGWAALALAVLIAFSRLYLYVHYPSDVLGGILLGTAFALFSVWLVDTIWQKLSQRSEKASAQKQ
ncbi:MAG: phosphatase PAP2 family protein [Clostridiales bacterium]|nr:phosphatase PAP2 family protein [Clostridiales bacterium]